MAAIAVVSGEELTEQTHTGDTDYVAALTVSAASWTANAKYILKVTAQVNCPAANLGVRLVRGATPTLFTGSEMIRDSISTPSIYDYTYLAIYDAPSPAEDVVLEFKTFNDARTVTADTIELIAIRLDDDLVEDTDWFFDEDTNDTALTTSFVDFALKTFTPGNNNDDWLITYTIQWAINNTNTNTNMRLRRDGSEASPTETSNFISEEGEKTDEQRVIGSGRVFTLSNASHTFAVQNRDEQAATQAHHLHSAVFGLRLNAFEDHGFFTYNETEIVYAADDTYEEIANLEITPSQEGNFIVEASAAYDAGAAVQRGAARLQVGGTTTPAGRDATDGPGAYDDGDEHSFFTMFLRNFAASEQDIDFDSKSNTRTGSPAAEDRSVVAYSVELAAAAAVDLIEEPLLHTFAIQRAANY